MACEVTKDELYAALEGHDGEVYALRDHADPQAGERIIAVLDATRIPGVTVHLRDGFAREDLLRYAMAVSMIGDSAGNRRASETAFAPHVMQLELAASPDEAQSLDGCVAFAEMSGGDVDVAVHSGLDDVTLTQIVRGANALAMLMIERAETL